jgi:hypothetical protein
VRTGSIEGNRVRVLTGLVNGERIVAQLTDELLSELSNGQAVAVTD